MQTDGGRQQALDEKLANGVEAYYPRTNVAFRDWLQNAAYIFRLVRQHTSGNEQMFTS